MAIDLISQILIVVVTVVLSLIICYAFFDNSFTYFLYFETYILLYFVAFGVIDFFYLSIAILFIAIIVYQSVIPQIRGDNE